MTIPFEHIGYYTDPCQSEPVYDPPLDVPCPFCGSPITPDTVRTASVWPCDGSAPSLFYRMHRACVVAASPEAVTALDVEVMEKFGAWQKRGAA